MLLLALAIPAAWIDARTRRVPNRLTLAFMAAGLVAAPLQGGWQALGSSLAAVFLTFAAGLLLHSLGALGGGDVKLIAAIGAIGGLKFLGETTAWTILLGFIVSAVVLAWHRALFPLLRRFARALWLSVVWHLEPDQPLVEGKGHPIPFGIVIAASSLIALIAERYGVRLLG